MKARVYWGLTVLAVGAIVWGIVWSSAQDESIPVVKTAEVLPTSMSQEVYATGTAQSLSRQELRSSTVGLIKNVNVKVGDTVKAGQVLVELDSAAADLQVTQAAAGLEMAEANLDLAQANLVLAQTPAAVPLELNGAAAQPNESALAQAKAGVRQAEAGLDQAQAGLKLARMQRDQLFIKAGVDGTVWQVNVGAGDYVSQQLPLLVIGDLQKLEVTVQLTELDAALVRVGQEVELTTRVLGSSTLSGTVARVAPEASVKAGYAGMTTPTVEVGIALKDTPAALRPGFSLNTAILVAAQDNVLAVPLEALFQEGKHSFVYKVENGKVHKTEVSLGISDEINQQVTAGLTAGDVVVLNPMSDFYDGMAVAVAGSEQR